MATHPTRRRRTRVGLAVAGLLAVGAVLARPAALQAWGDVGHRLVGATAAGALPPQMPAFFRHAGARLAYLNPEPDRWRERAERQLDPALDGATAPDHFIDLEMIPADRRAGALAAPTRYAYADTLRALGVDPAVVGVLPFRIVELTQQLRVDFRNWRAAKDDSTRAWVQQRIIEDAGILGHYVADGSNPAHTTIHYNGWVGENPNGYATDRAFHGRFESAFVQARITAPDVRAALGRAGGSPQVFPDVRAATIAYLQRSNALVDSLYKLDRAATFNAENTDPASKQFAADRLAAGAAMLRDLWWTAWVTSADSSRSLPVRKD